MTMHHLSFSASFCSKKYHNVGSSAILIWSSSDYFLFPKIKLKPKDILMK